MTASSRRRVFALAVVVAVAAAVGLGSYLIVADGRTAKSAKEDGKGAGKGGALVPVTVVRVVQETVPVRLNAIGNVEAYSTVQVKSRVDGQITDVNVREGAAVKKGDVLFRIDVRPFEAALRQAEANALRDVAARDHTRSQEKRYQELLEKNFISKDAYAQIRTNAATAEATAKASQAALENARLNLEYCTIRSALDGYVGRVLLQAGNMVRTNDVNALLVINQVRPIYVNFAVPEQNLPEVRQYMAKGPLAVDVVPPDQNAPRPAGRLIFIDNAVDATTGTIRLRAQFDNADAALWPGQFVNVSLRLYEQPDALVVPSTAVQTGPEGQYVYVVSPEMVADVRRIAVQRTDGERSIIAKGLAKDELVVVRGQLRLGPKTRVQIAKPAAAEVS
jgi:membrane fusion protein, multidrug efflux system